MDNQQQESSLKQPHKSMLKPLKSLLISLSFVQNFRTRIIPTISRQNNCEMLHFVISALL